MISLHFALLTKINMLQKKLSVTVSYLQLHRPIDPTAEFCVSVPQSTWGKSHDSTTV